MFVGKNWQRSWFLFDFRNTIQLDDGIFPHDVPQSAASGDVIRECSEAGLNNTPAKIKLTASWMLQQSCILSILCNSQDRRAARSLLTMEKTSIQGTALTMTKQSLQREPKEWPSICRGLKRLNFIGDLKSCSDLNDCQYPTRYATPTTLG